MSVLSNVPVNKSWIGFNFHIKQGLGFILCLLVRLDEIDTDANDKEFVSFT
jgi:hypothetical protein